MNITLLWASALFFLAVVIGGMILLILPCFRRAALGDMDAKARMLISFSAALVILSCVVPMGLSPVYNGEAGEYRNQYEMITEAFLKGQLHFQYEADERLLAMENPYDMAERRSGRFLLLGSRAV